MFDLQLDQSGFDDPDSLAEPIAQFSGRGT